MIKHYINVNEKDSTYFITDSSYSYHIGFVYDVDKDNEYPDNNFGYIIANNKQFGLSYYTLSNYLTDVQNKCIEHSMMYHTNELLNCAEDHKAFLNEIRVSKSILNTYFINSVTIKLRTKIDKEKTGATTPAYMIIRDRNEVDDNSITNTKLLTCPRSINSIVQSDYANKYVTFYFDHVLINTSNNRVDLSVSQIVESEKIRAEEVENQLRELIKELDLKIVQSDWNEENSNSQAFIKNKPTKLSEFENDEGFVKSSEVYKKNEIDLSNTIITLDDASVKTYDILTLAK